MKNILYRRVSPLMLVDKKYPCAYTLLCKWKGEGQFFHQKPRCLWGGHFHYRKCSHTLGTADDHPPAQAAQGQTVTEADKVWPLQGRFKQAGSWLFERGKSQGGDNGVEML
jgi:hypothetical protein